MTQLVEALRHKPGYPAFDSRWGPWTFSSDLILLSAFTSTEVHSVSYKNECQRSSLWVRATGTVQAIPPLILHDLLRECFTLLKKKVEYLNELSKKGGIRHNLKTHKKIICNVRVQEAHSQFLRTTEEQQRCDKLLVRQTV